MPPYSNSDVIVAWGYWRDEVTWAGVKAGDQPATVTFDPVPLTGSDTPNLRDTTARGWLKTRQRVARVDPTTGYFAALLVANNDPDLDAYGGRRVTFSGETPFVVEVPWNTTTVTADAAMVAALKGSIPGLAVGASVKAVPLIDLALTSPSPTPPSSYLTTTQTLSALATAVDVHDTDPDAHADIRALVGQGGVSDATTTAKGVARLLGGTADAPTAPWSKVTGAPTSYPPSGGAGGVLSGSYPNPGFAVDMATQAELDAAVAAVPEQARDAIGAALVAGANVGISVNDAADTITISATTASGTTVPTRTTTANTTAVPGELLVVDASGGQRTITPPASPALGTFVTVLKSDSSANYVVWDGPTNSDTSAGLVKPWSGARFTWLGTVWAVTATNPVSVGSNDRADHFGTEPISAVSGLQGALDAKATTTALAAHTTDTTNPHAVTKAQVGLGSVDNTSDVNKPLSTAAAAALAGKAALLTQRSPAATANTTAGAGEIVPLDTTGGTFTLTGPTGGTFWGWRWRAGTAANAPTIAAGAGYTISGATSITPGLAPGGSSGELVVYELFGTDYQPVGGFKPQSALAAVFDPAGAASAVASTLSTHTSATTNVHGILDTGDLYRPSLRLPRWPVPTQVVSLFQSGHGFTANGTGVTSNLNDTSTFVKGAQSATVTSGGTGAQANLDNVAVSSLDLTGKLIRLTFKVDDITNLASINFFLGTSSLANNFRWRVQTTTNNSVASNYIQSGEWVTITLGWADVASASGTFTYSNGAPSARSGFTNVRCQIIDNNTANPVTVHWQAIEIIPDGSSVFPNGVVSIGFDDSWQSVYTLARPRLDQYGYGATMWTITDLVGSGAPRVTLDSLLSLQDRSGWEIGAHAYQNSGHTSTDTGMTAAQLDTDARNQKAWLVGNGFYGEGHAYPQGRFGRTSDNVSTQSVIRKYFAYGRTILYGDTVETFPPADPYKLRALSGVSSVGTNRQLPSNITSAGGLLDRVKNNQGWLIIVFHELIASGTPSATTVCTQADFNSVVDAVASRGMPCLPVGDVLRYYSP